MYLFFDTETTGLPKNYKAPVTDFDNWPRLVQLAYIYTDETGNVIETGNFIIKPEGFEISEEVSKIHGITHEIALKKGKNVKKVLKKFSAFVLNAKIIVGHNVSFDRKIIGSELLRNEFEDVLHGKERICTMFSSTKYCNIPNQYGNAKWPKLQELHFKLFNENFEDAHDAFNDIKATVKCFFELKRLEIIK
ncbi:MAG: 3'-5' exonuclease [Lutibacter sp.]|jgi:DNA polymerase III epsilon subunit-like protein